MERFILDPYIIRAIHSVNAKEIDVAAGVLYPDLLESESPEEDIQLIQKWLDKLRKKPGLALSTGRRKSDRGILTCSLLAVLGVQMPKSARTRTQLAWDIVNSYVGKKNIGTAPELDAERSRCEELAKQPRPPVFEIGFSVFGGRSKHR